MARPIKSGLDYFPLPVDFFESEILDGITGEFGIKGELITIKLLSTVYKKGYFAVWNDLLQAQIAKKSSSSKDLVIQVVDRLVTWGFFDESLYNSAKVLTSAEIQDVYFEATKRRKTPKSTKYLVNVSNNPTSTVVNTDINTQIKGNKTKVNKTKVDAVGTNTSSNNKVSGDSLPKANHQQLYDFYQNNFGAISPFVIQELSFDADDYGDELVQLAMEKALLNRANYKYAQGILKSWERNGIKTVEQANAEDKQHQQKRSNSNNADNKWNNMPKDDAEKLRTGATGYTQEQILEQQKKMGW